MGEEVEDFLPNFHGAPHHVRPQSRGGTGDFEDLFHWPGVAKNQNSRKHSAFHTIYHNATLLEVVQRLPTFENRNGTLNVDFLTAKYEKGSASRAWKALHGREATPWESFEYLIKLLGPERFQYHISDQLDGRCVAEFLQREEAYLRFFLRVPSNCDDTRRSSDEWSKLYKSWRLLVGPSTFLQGILLLPALERRDDSLHVEFLTRTTPSGKAATAKKQFLHMAWRDLFGSLDTPPWEAALRLRDLFGGKRIAKALHWQLQGRGATHLLKRQHRYFDVIAPNSDQERR